MSWQIPQQIEQDIIAGKAQYRNFQTGVGGQSILPVPTNAYAVVFGYDFSPAGGGIFSSAVYDINIDPQLNPSNLRFFQTQQISFYTGTDFFPFIHHVDAKTSINTGATNVISGVVTQIDELGEIDTTPICRQVYITSTNDVTITHGLILTATPAVQNAIPITNRTPRALTYGGSGQVLNTQTNYGPAGTPLQFMQPSPKDFQDFAFGLLPGNADNQAFATPDATNGLLDSTTLLTTFGDPFVEAAASNYYLCMHYAIYSKTIPEQRG